MEISDKIFYIFLSLFISTIITYFIKIPFSELILLGGLLLFVSICALKFIK
jgi:hypothetical protein